MLISTATLDDIAGLLTLEESGFDPRERWSDQSWVAEIGQPGHLVVMHKSHERAESAACFALSDDVCELRRVVVDPKRRRCGQARRLLCFGLDWAQACGAGRMMLEVHQHNDAAMGLYRAMGFVPIAMRKNYYGAGQDAVIMEREVHHQ